MLYYLISEMDERFSNGLSTTIRQIKLLLPVALTEWDEFQPLSSADITDLVSLFNDDLPAPADLDTERHFWTVKWQGKIQNAADLNTHAKALSTIDGDFFPNIQELLKIVCTLPVTSIECKYSISCLRHLKMYQRSTMQEDCLNGLAMLYVHKDIPCSPEAVVMSLSITIQDSYN